jgi:hypothetical protein
MLYDIEWQEAPYEEIAYTGKVCSPFSPFFFKYLNGFPFPDTHAKFVKRNFPSLVVSENMNAYTLVF